MNNRPREHELKRVMGRVAELMISTTMTQREIGREVGVGEATISKWKKKQVWKEIYDRKAKEYYRNN